MELINLTTPVPHRAVVAAALVLSGGCTQFVDLSAGGECRPPPPTCTAMDSSCEFPAPEVSNGFDPADRTTAALFGWEAVPAVASSPDVTLVVWTHFGCQPGGFTTRSCQMTSTRVSADAVVELASASGCGAVVEASAAWNGEIFLVVGRVGGAVTAARYAENGSALDTACLSLGNGSVPALAPVPGGFAVIWVESTGAVRIARVGTDGTTGALGAPLSMTATTTEPPAIASNGSLLLAAWTEAGSATTNAKLSIATLDFAGTRLSALLPVSDTNGSSHPAVASDGTNFLLAWGDFRESSGPVLTSRTYLSRITPAGIVLDPGGRKWSTTPPSATSSVQTGLRLVFDGAAYQALWVDWPWQDPFNTTLTTARLALDGSILPGDTAVTTGVALDGFALTGQAGRSDLYFEQSDDVWRVSLDAGIPDLASRLRVSRGINSQEYPQVEATEDQVVVAWNEERVVDLNQQAPAPSLLARRFDTASNAIDAAPLTLSDNAERNTFALASNGKDHLVVWQERSGTGLAFQLRAVVLSGAGDAAVGSPNQVTVVSQRTDDRPALCFSGDTWALWFTLQERLWVQHLDRGGAPLDVPTAMGDGVRQLRVDPKGCLGAALVNNALTRIDLSMGVPRLMPIDGLVTPTALLSAASTEGRLFVAWAESSGGGAYNVSWRVLDGDGAETARFGPEAVFTTAPGMVPAAVATPAGFMLAWVGNEHLDLQRISPAGVKLGTPQSMGASTWADLKPAPGGALALASTALDAQGLVQRIVVSRLSWKDVGQTCGDAAQCASGTCGVNTPKPPYAVSFGCSQAPGTLAVVLVLWFAARWRRNTH